MSTLAFVNGLIALAMGVLMGLVALAFPDSHGAFEEAGYSTAVAGALVMLATAHRLGRIQRMHTFLLTASVWLTAGLAGGLPLWLGGLTPVDALFESMSGMTTTGATVMSGLDDQPRSVLLWRALLQAMGGVGFVVTGMALLPVLRVGGMQLFRTESSDKEDASLGPAGQVALGSVAAYVLLIGLCTGVYAVGGMSGFDAVTHAMTTLASGGYANYDASFGHFDSPFLQWSATLFLLCAALPFAFYIKAATRRSFASEQIRAMLVTLTAVILALTAWRVATSDTAPADALREVACSVISVVSTTGFAVEDYTTWGPLAVTAFFILTAVGGCTGSTAGGVKAMRWIVAWRGMRLRLAGLTRPHVVLPLRYEGRRIDPDVFDGVVVFFAFFALTLAATTAALSLIGLDLATSVSGALTALCNVGPGVGTIIGPAGSFASLPDSAKLVLTAAMYLGRLEMLTVFVLLTPRFWAAA